MKDPLVAKRFEYILNIKSKVRHKVVTCFDDFDDDSKEFLLRLKKEVFSDNDIYVYGSRVNGTYLSDEEFNRYSSEYPNVKKSDWDIRSLYKPKQTEFLGYKIDFNFGTNGIKV